MIRGSVGRLIPVYHPHPAFLQHPQQLHGVVNLQLGINMGPVGFNRFNADRKALTNLSIASALCDEACDLMLPLCQQIPYGNRAGALMFRGRVREFQAGRQLEGAGILRAA